MHRPRQTKTISRKRISTYQAQVEAGSGKILGDIKGEETETLQGATGRKNQVVVRVDSYSVPKMNDGKSKAH